MKRLTALLAVVLVIAGGGVAYVMMSDQEDDRFAGCRASNVARDRKSVV